MARSYTRYHSGYRKGKLTLIRHGKTPQKWVCRCDCGNVIEVQVSEATMCRQCAYEKMSKEKKTHGDASRKGKKFGRTRLYNIWSGMRSRCNNARDTTYCNYGGRGISVCAEWDDFSRFKEWAFKNRYDDSLTIDRIDVDGNYEPKNCRWITHKEQMANTRRTHNITIDGQTMPVVGWCERLGIQKGNLYCNCKKYKMTVGYALEYIYKNKPQRVPYKKISIQFKEEEE